MSPEFISRLRFAGANGGRLVFLTVFALICIRLFCLHAGGDKSSVEGKLLCQTFNISLTVTAHLELCSRPENEFPWVKILMQNSAILELLPSEATHFLRWLDNCLAIDHPDCPKIKVLTPGGAKSQNFFHCSHYSPFSLGSSAVNLCFENQSASSFLTLNGFPFSRDETLLIHSLLRSSLR